MVVGHRGLVIPALQITLPPGIHSGAVPCARVHLASLGPHLSPEATLDTK